VQQDASSVSRSAGRALVAVTGSTLPHVLTDVDAQCILNVSMTVDVTVDVGRRVTG